MGATHHNMHIRYAAKEYDLRRMHRPLGLRKRLRRVFK